MSFKIKRVYEARQASDGVRVLVDRLWPRGLTKSAAALDAWLKEVAPTTKLRIWFGHNPGKFSEFARRYGRELKASAAFRELRALGRGRAVTLLYAARDLKVNHAQVLKAALASKAAPKRRLTRPRSAR